MKLHEIRRVIDDVIAAGVDAGHEIYKICPKCNANHNGTCNFCAWQGTMNVCDVGVGIFQDGSRNMLPLQVVKRHLNDNCSQRLYSLWNVQYFPSADQAKKALAEYDVIRNIKDSSERIAAYNQWVTERRKKYTRGDIS